MLPEILSRLGIGIDLATKILYSILVLIAARISITFLRPSIRKIDEHMDQIDLSKSTHKLIENAIKYCIYALAVIAILYVFGLNEVIYGIITGGAVLGFAIGYASQDIVSNMLSGIMIAVDRPFKLGDRIMASGITGIVKDIALRTTKVELDDGTTVLIPNASLMKSPIHNYTTKKNA